jgi:hypothetical protein
MGEGVPVMTAEMVMFGWTSERQAAVTTGAALSDELLAVSAGRISVALKAYLAPVRKPHEQRHPDRPCVHGYWHGGWCWTQVVEELAARGLASVARPGRARAQQPLAERALEQTFHPRGVRHRAAAILERHGDLQRAAWLGLLRVPWRENDVR